jgi:putative transposase
MSNYRRVWAPEGRYFFTVNLLRRDQCLLVEHRDALRSAFRQTQLKRPFDILAIVVLPEHLHCLWKLPPGDADNATRWSHIKALFSRAMPVGEHLSERRAVKRERGIWQRRYWEHWIQNEADFAAHVDYIHYNPVKHGHVTRVADWPYSSFHRYVRQGILPADWASPPQDMATSGEKP